MDTKVPTEVVSKLIGIVADSENDDEVSFIALQISYENAHLEVKRRDGTSETHSYSEEEAENAALRALFS
jgi:hypothetical protein